MAPSRKNRRFSPLGWGSLYCSPIYCWLSTALDFRKRNFYHSTLDNNLQRPTYIVTALVVIFIPKKIKKNWGTTRIELGLSNLPTFVDIGLGLLGFIATILISAFVTNIMSGFDWFDANQAQNIGYNVLNTGFDRIVAFLALVVFAPIAEEIIFRGWLYGKLRKTIAAPAAIILVSFLFGFLHGQLNVGITVGIMSIAMCVEREMTGTIYASILTHMIKNGIAFWIIYVLT